MIKKEPFSLRLFQQAGSAKSAKGSLSVSYAELTPMSELMELDSTLAVRFAKYSGGYPAIFGGQKLRGAIATYLGVSPQDVIVTNGIDDAMPSIYEALLSAGDRLSLLLPTYDPIPERARINGAQIVTARLANNVRGWAIDDSTMKQLLDPNIAACALNVPHNPTGWYPDVAERQALSDMAEQNDVYIIADEVYGGLPQNQDDELKSLASISSKCVSVGSLTKAFGLPGLRIGWIACTNAEIITQIKNIRTFSHCYFSALSEMAAITALTNADVIIAKKIEIVRRNLDALKAFSEQFPAFSMDIPRHGTVAMAHVDATKFGFSSASELCAEFLKGRGVILIDNTFFDDAGDWVRFGFGVSSFGVLLPELTAFLKER